MSDIAIDDIKLKGGDMISGFDEQEVLEVDIPAEWTQEELIATLGELAGRLEREHRRHVLVRCNNEVPVGPAYANAIRDLARRGTAAGVRTWAVCTTNCRKRLAVDRLLREGAAPLAAVYVSTDEEAVVSWAEQRIFGEVSAPAGAESRDRRAAA